MKRLIGPFIFLLCLIVYLVTLSPGAYPGESARTIVQFSGVDPFPPLTHPVYSFVARLLAAVPVGSLEARFNLFSAVCGALCAWLVYLIVSRLAHDRTFEETMARFSAPFVQTLSGVVAALLFAFSIPVWVVNTRAHTASLDLLLLLTAIYSLMQFGRSSKFSWAVAACAVWGLGLTEFATCIILLPLFAMTAIYFLWRAGRLNVPSMLTLTCCGLAGLAVYFLHAAWYCGTPAYGWRSFTGFWEVLKYILLGQYHMITGGLPKHGWLLVWIVTFVPWLIVFFSRMSGDKTGSRGAWLGSYLLNGVLTAIAMAVLFNGRFAPWTMTNGRPLLVTPYLFFAVWTGYLAGYWYVVLGNESRRDLGLTKVIRRALKLAYLPLLFVLLVAATALNARTANGGSGALAARFADEVLDSLDGRTWLVSNGTFDDHLMLAARRRGLDLHVLNSVPFGSANAYTRYLSTLFDEPRLKSMARIGLQPLMGELLATRPDTPDRFAVLIQPDLWFAGGYEPAPNKTLFLGAKIGISPADLSERVAGQHAFWNRYGQAIGRAARQDDKSLAAPWNRWIAGHISRVANNFGVYLEDRGFSDDAFGAYRASRNLETNNVSALVNMHALAQRDNRPDFQHLDAELNAFVKAMQAAGRRVWAVSQSYGYIRSAEFYSQRGWAWAMSGKPNLAAVDIKRAAEMSGQQDNLQLALGQMYLGQNMSTQSEAAYLAVLENDPDQKDALLGMLLLSLGKNDVDGARGYLARLAELKAPPPLLKLHEATIEALAGNFSAAKSLLSQVVQDQPILPQAWAALATVALELDDKETLDKALAKLQAARSLAPGIRLTVARIALARSDRASARHQLNELLRQQSGHVQALEMILRLDIYDRQRDLAEQHVQQLIAADRENAFGNFFMGLLQTSHEDEALAETSFRVSLARERTTETLNELSWLLAKRGQYDEARVLVQESLAKNRDNGSAWDTLGFIYFKTDKIGDAEKSFQEALRLKPDDPDVVLHTIWVLEKKGLTQEALDLADSLLARPAELDKDTFDEVRDLAKRLRAST